jgi:LuxR family maltose regulon positive regulatory protein
MLYIKKLKKLATAYQRPLDVAEAFVLQAVLEWTTGFQTEAMSTLETVLIEMQPYYVIRIIADEGAAVLPILKKIASRMNQPNKSCEIHKQYLNQIILCAYEVSKNHKGIAVNLKEKSVKLSKQQTYILSLLAQGYKNAEIVNMTGLTINTIKSHTKMVYSKLNVHNAADAIIKAKSLSILT